MDTYTESIVNMLHDIKDCVAMIMEKTGMTREEAAKWQTQTLVHKFGLTIEQIGNLTDRQIWELYLEPICLEIEQEHNKESQRGSPIFSRPGPLNPQP